VNIKIRSVLQFERQNIISHFSHSKGNLQLSLMPSL